MVEWVAGAEEEIRARLTAWSGRSERGVQRPTNLAEDRQKGERDANGNDAMFDRAVIGVVFGEGWTKRFIGLSARVPQKTAGRANRGTCSQDRA